MAVAAGQAPPQDAVVYVYTPATSASLLNWPLNGCPAGSVHVPQVTGEPPRWVKRSCVPEPAQTVNAPLLPALSGAVMARSTPLSAVVSAGVLLTTRMRYPVPAAVPPGMTQLMMPEVVAVTEPMSTGAAKLPVALESWAVKTLPGRKEPWAV